MRGLRIFMFAGLLIAFGFLAENAFGQGSRSGGHQGGSYHSRNYHGGSYYHYYGGYNRYQGYYGYHNRYPSYHGYFNGNYYLRYEFQIYRHPYYPYYQYRYYWRVIPRY